MTDREEFLEIFRTHVTRPGSEKLLDWMDSKTDFFSAPASTRFHGACEGGLCAHSLNVYRVLHGTFFTPGEDSEETFAICALLHDLCKANFYKKGTRNVKNEATGQWEKVPSYSVEDMFPYGHGEKSVFLIERFMKLKVEEAVAIRWHMGGFDDAVRGGSFALSGAFEKYPLAVKLHIADLEATYLLEQRQINHWDFEKSIDEDPELSSYHVGFTVIGCELNRYYRARAMHLVEWDGDRMEGKATQTNGVLLTDHEI